MTPAVIAGAATPLELRVDADDDHTLVIWEHRGGQRGGTKYSFAPCDVCGTVLKLAPRTVRDLRAQRRVPRCHTCRHPPAIHVSDELFLWWLLQYDPDELVELAEPLPSRLTTIAAATDPSVKTRAARWLDRFGYRGGTAAEHPGRPIGLRRQTTSGGV